MRQNTANADLRERAASANVFWWQIASMCNVSETTMVKWMRVEMPEDDPHRLLIESALSQFEQKGK